MKKQRFLMVLAGIAGCLSLVAFQGGLDAQGSLSIGGNSSNFGSRTLVGGFTPDPSTQSIVSGGSLAVRGMGLGNGCVGFATRQPDFILQYQNARSFLRFYFQGQGDTSLIINDASGRWHCNDDTAGLNPQVDISQPPSGQYDIWVGSYRAGENISGTLNITELRSHSVSN